jgi:riboflavin kinase/FMN adenylyltransferase
MDMLHGLDVLFLDALRYKPHPTHSTIEKSLGYVRRLSPRRTYFTHMSHDVEHVQGESLLPPHVHLAHDGVDLMIGRGRQFSVWRAPDHLPAGDHPRAVTIGNFDGTHRGHQALFRRIAEQQALIPAVLTFDPHPARLLKPEKAPRLLTTIERRFAAMEKHGIKQVLVLPFTKEISGLQPDEFVRRILVEDLQTRYLVVGENFRYGAQQAGDIESLRAAGARYGFTVEVLSGVMDRGRLVSSTLVRNLIASGAVAKAARLLPGPYGLDGRVVAGHGVGRTQTVPTLNLETASEILPQDGVYVTRTQDLDSDRRWRSITNIGVRPTFQGESRTIETYLLDALTDPAPHRIRVDFLHRVREERKFRDGAALKEQILKDVARAQAWFRHAARVAPDQG